MNSLNEDLISFDVLGYHVRLKSDSNVHGISPQEVVEVVRVEANKILDKAPQLNSGQVAILVALQLANDLLSSKKEFKNNLDQLQDTARTALQYIEEVSPSSL